MASRRLLKKQIYYITGELYVHCLLTMPLSGDNRGDIISIIAKIIKLQNEYIRRLSHIEPGSIKLFFNEFKNSFDAKVDEITDDQQKLKK